MWYELCVPSTCTSLARSTSAKRGELPSHADSAKKGEASAADCSTRQAACDGLPMPQTAKKHKKAPTTSNASNIGRKGQRRQHIWQRSNRRCDLSSAGASTPAGASSRRGRGLRGVNEVGDSGSISARCERIRGLREHDRVVSTRRCATVVKNSRTLSRTAAALLRGLATACGVERAAKLRATSLSRRQKQTGFSREATTGRWLAAKGGQRARAHANAAVRPRPRPSRDAQISTESATEPDEPPSTSCSAMHPGSQHAMPRRGAQQRGAAARAVQGVSNGRGALENGFC